MAQELKSAAREANSSIRGVVSDVQSSLEDAGAEASETVKKVVHDLSKAGNKIADVGKDTLGEYTKKGKEQLKSVESYIQEYPIRSVLISAAVGIFLTKLIRQ